MLLDQESLETADDSRREVSQIVEDSRNRLFLKPNIAECWLNGKLGLHLHCRWRHRKFCLIFQPDWFGEEKLVADLQHTGPGLIDLKKRSVLVDDVQFVNDPQGVRPVIIPVVVRLQSINLCLGGIDDACYFWSASGLVEVRTLIDREFDTVTFVGGQSPSQMIQAGAQLEDNLTSQNGSPLQIFGTEETVRRFESWYSGLDIQLWEGRVTVSSGKPSDFPFQIDDVLFGPLELSPNYTERMRRAG